MSEFFTDFIKITADNENSGRTDAQLPEMQESIYQG